MASSDDALLGIVVNATTLGNSISLKMVDFLNEVNDQPVGFRDLGLDFLAICKILNSLQGSLKEQFQSKQTVPTRAASELTRVLSKTIDDFERLANLLHKFMEFEKGGAVAKLQKTWRLVFADKDIAKIRGSLQVNEGALKMAMLLVNITPVLTTAPPAYEYGMLAARLDQKDAIVESANTSTLVSDHTPNEPRAFGAHDFPSAIPPPVPPRSDAILTPAMSTLSVAKKDLDSSSPPRIESQQKEIFPAIEGDWAPDVEKTATAAPEGMVQEKCASEHPPRIFIDRSKIQKRLPKNPMATSSAALTKTLVTAVIAHKHNIVDQLLERGVSPDSGPETCVVMDAVYQKDPVSLKLLLEFGADPDAGTKDGKTPLRFACQHNHEEEARLLLEYGADPNLSAPTWGPLPWALDTNSESLVRLLLRYGANPDFVMQNGWTSLIYACDRKTLPSIVEDLFKYGANPNGKDATDSTPLRVACDGNNADLVKVLLSHGADPNLPGKQLPICVSVPHPACLELLVAAGADLHAYTGIMEAATYHNCMESVKLLLDAGVDPNEKESGIYSPVTTAIRDNHPDILVLLLSRGADPNFIGQDLPLKMAINKPALLKLLIDGGADVKSYQGLIEFAVYHNCVESIPILLEAGVPIDEKHCELYTGITTAIRDNHVECLAFLLSHGANPNEPGEGLPILRAAQCEDSQRLEMLLDAGADVNKQLNDRTALMQACEYNRVDNVRVLLARGASVDLVDGTGSSAMDIAAVRGHDEIVMMLLERMS